MSNMHQYGHDTYPAPNDGFAETLFSEREHKALQSFLNGLEQEDQNFATGQDTQMSFHDLPPTTYTSPLSHHPHTFHPAAQRANTYPQTQAINIPRAHPSQNQNPIMLSSPQSLTTSFSLPQNFANPMTPPIDTVKSNGSPPNDKRRRASITTDAGGSSGLPAKSKRKMSIPSGSSPKSELPQIPPHRPGRRKGTTKVTSNSSPKNTLSPPQTDTPLSDSPEPAKSSARGKKAPHELLTEEEKKANHIASEQKRRANIRVGFDQLVELVPTLSACHRSEALILQKSVEYIEQLIANKNDLKDRVRELTGVLGENSNMDDDSSEGELDMAY